MNGRGQYAPDRRAGSRPEFVPKQYTPQEQKEISEKLERILGPEYVSFRPGGNGQRVSYIEGWKALNLANEIFGFNGWSTELIGTQVDFLDTSSSGRVSLGLSVVVRVTIKDGTFHEDFGYGFIENAKSKSMAFEKCKKEAFTDAIKRCLRCFGNVLGNCLYDKTIIPKIQKMQVPPVDPTPSQFHREPDITRRDRRERDKQRQTQQEIENRNRHNHQNHDAPNQRIQPLAKEQEPETHEVDDFDDSFMFSDDVDHNGLDDYDLQMIEAQRSDPADHEKAGERLNENENEKRNGSEEQANGNQATPGNTEQTTDIPPGDVQLPPLFVSARTVDDIRLSKAKVTQFDTKYVSPSMGRTTDPTKSVPIKRSGKPAPAPPVTGNLQPVTHNYADPPVGKRPLGRPPSQRLQKRMRLETSDQENRVPTEFTSSFSSA